MTDRSPGYPHHGREAYGTQFTCQASAIVLLLLLASGCAGFETFPLPTGLAHSQSNYQEKEGLSIAAQMLHSSLTSRYHFGPDVRKAGYLPVFVSFENRGKSSFNVQRRNFWVVLENGERLEPVPPEEIFAKVRRSTLPAFILAPLVLPAIWLHHHLEAYNFKAAKTMYEKSLPLRLRLEKNDMPFTRVVFFRDLAGAQTAPRNLASSVLHVLVEIEGSRPPASRSVATPGGTEPANATPTEVVETTPSGPDRIVGSSVTFTVSLNLEDG